MASVRPVVFTTKMQTAVILGAPMHITTIVPVSIGMCAKLGEEEVTWSALTAF